MAAQPPRPLSKDPLVGTVLGDRIQITGLIERGGMGTIYQGKDLVERCRTAVKVLYPETDPGYVARFHQEAWALSQLDHPNCVRILHTGQTADGRPYLAMEFVEGASLAKVLEAMHVMDPPRIREVMMQVLAGLSAAHDRGITHRDVKPANIMLLRRADATGRMIDFVKLCDFGLAKVHDESAGTDDEGNPLTQQGVAVGTPEFMAPEQVSAGEVDARTDVYACGVIMYRMMTGRMPFIGDSALAVMAQIARQDAPPIARIAPLADRDLVQVAQTAMSRDPAARYASASDMLEALKRCEGPSSRRPRVLDTPIAPARPIPPKRELPVRQIGIGLGAVLVVGMLGYALFSDSIPDSDDTWSVLERMTPHVACPDARGELAIPFGVTRDGVTVHPEINPDVPGAKCLSAQLATWRFPRMPDHALLRGIAKFRFIPGQLTRLDVSTSRLDYLTLEWNIRQVDSPLSEGAIDDQLERMLPQIKTCFERFHPPFDWEGKLDALPINFSVDTSGALTRVVVGKLLASSAGGWGGQTFIGQCITVILKNTALPIAGHAGDPSVLTEVVIDVHSLKP